MGTQRVEEEVNKLFPDARTLRWDHETTRKKGAHEIILSHFTNHRADILIGTQMLAKGLDLPLVTLVGVVLADVGLTLPDFRASERVFQVLAQVAGRPDAARWVARWCCRPSSPSITSSRPPPGTIMPGLPKMSWSTARNWDTRPLASWCAWNTAT